MMNENKTAMLIREADFFEEFYEQYHIYVYKLVKEQCWRPEDVEDVVQGIWEKLFGKKELLASLSVPQQVQYITSTIRNTIIKDVRKKKLEICSLESVLELGYDGTVRMERRVERQMTSATFREVWNLVDPSIRELLERKYLLEESDSDIAAAMQIKTNSVRTYLSRARKAARSVLQPYSEQLGR